MIEGPAETTDLCFAANPASRVYLVPAFTGLGAPHWHAETRGAVFGMTRTTGRAEFVRATVESIAFQIFDVVDAMQRDSGVGLAELRVDGGPTRDAYLMQFVADMLRVPIVAAGNDEMSGLGAAWCAGIALGLYPEDVAHSVAPRASWDAKMHENDRIARIKGWRRAVKAAIAVAG